MYSTKKTILFLIFCFAVVASDFKSVTANFVKSDANKPVTNAREFAKLEAPEVLASSIVLIASQAELNKYEFKQLGKYTYHIEPDLASRTFFIEQQNIKDSSLRLVRYNKTGKYAVTDGSIIISYIEQEPIFELVKELNLEVVSHTPRIGVISVKTANFNELNELLEAVQKNGNVKQAYLDVDRQEMLPR